MEVSSTYLRESLQCRNPPPKDSRCVNLDGSSPVSRHLPLVSPSCCSLFLSLSRCIQDAFAVASYVFRSAQSIGDSQCVNIAWGYPNRGICWSRVSLGCLGVNKPDEVREASYSRMLALCLCRRISSYKSVGWKIELIARLISAFLEENAHESLEL